MNLKTYLSTLERGGATQLADALGVSISFLSQMASGAAAISPERCVAIEKSTDGAVTRKDLRPDGWHLIWPELGEKLDAGEPSHVEQEANVRAATSQGKTPDLNQTAKAA